MKTLAPVPTGKTTKFDRAAASLIAGEGPPAWLVEGLARVAIHGLAPAIKAAHKNPSRADLAAKIREVERAMDILVKVLGRHTPAGVALAGGGPGPLMEEHREIRIAIQRGPKTKVAGALKRLSLPGRGKEKYGSDPVKDCAAAVVVAWHKIHGTWPPPSSLRACEAAAAIWHSAGGQASKYSHGPSSASGWRTHIKSVLPPAAGQPSPGLELMWALVWQRLAPPDHG
jgi:hypothetical protein